MKPISLLTTLPVGLILLGTVACGGGGIVGTGKANIAPVPRSGGSPKPEASLVEKSSLFAKALDLFLVKPFAVEAAAPSTVTVSIDGGGVTITKALIVFSEIDFKHEGEGKEDDFEVTGPFLLRMVGSGTIPDEITGIEVPAGNFDEIRFRIDDLDDKNLDGDVGDSTDEAPVNVSLEVVQTSGLVGKSILIQGSVTPTGGSAVNFTFTTDLDEKVRVPFTAAGLPTISSGQVLDFLVAIDFKKVFNSVNADQAGATSSAQEIHDAAVASGGALDPDTSLPQSARNVAKAIEDAIDDSIDLFNDKDNDDLPDPDEDIGDVVTGTPASD